MLRQFLERDGTVKTWQIGNREITVGANAIRITIDTLLEGLPQLFLQYFFIEKYLANNEEIPGFFYLNHFMRFTFYIYQISRVSLIFKLQSYFLKLLFSILFMASREELEPQNGKHWLSL